MSALRRDIGLWRGIALNMIDMVGIGPFITIPFILSAMGGGRGMLAWILGGLLAISDGLVTAELSAEMPSSGGSYVFLREAYGRAGRLISFLFLFQILFSAPLSMASGCIGFANYLKVLVPAAGDHVAITATAVCVVTMLLLLRRIEAIGKFSILLWAGVLATLAIVIVSGLPHLKLEAFTFWRAPRLDAGTGYVGLGTALIFAVYDYLGYYNICYIGDEVQEPTKTIPRVIVISILAIGAIYLLMNACLISVLPMKQAMTSPSVVADYLAALLGTRAAKWISILILWTAFASIFSLMLGYSRILYAAARDGNFFRLFAKLHATEAYPIVSILFLGCVAMVFCWIPLRHVLQAILSIRAIIPFVAQIVGAVILRRREPDRPRPFRMWIYPLPAIIAVGLWGYIVISPEKGLRVGGLYVMAAGTLFYIARGWLEGRRKPVLPLLLLLLCGCATAKAPAGGAVAVNDDFRKGALGWKADVTDYSVGMEIDFSGAIAPKPPELGAGTAFRVHSRNASDDLFVFLKKKLGPADGIVGGRRYEVAYRIVMASNAGTGCVGVGGAPGEDVTLKAGASPIEPKPVTIDGFVHINVDKGNQKVGGPAASVAGDVANGSHDCSDHAPFISFERVHRHTTIVPANAAGEIWLLVGTDSGFEGVQTLYYQSISATLTPAP